MDDIQTRLLKIIEYFVPVREYTTFEEINFLRKCRILTGSLLALILVSSALAIIVPIVHQEYDLIDRIMSMVPILAITNLIILRKTGSVQFVSWSIFIIIGVATTSIIAISGGINDEMTLHFLWLPVIATFFLGLRIGVFTAVFIAAILFIFRLASEQISTWQLVESLPEDSWGNLILGHYLAILAITILCWLFEQSRVAAESRMQEMYSTLQQVHDELLIARNASDAANQAKGAFLATMSHEIRTPLNGVIGMTNLLLDTEQAPQQQEYTRIIRNSGESLLTIINDILDFSKIEAGKVELEEQAYDLQTCLDQAIDLIAVTANEKEIQLLQNVPTTVPVNVIGDPTRLRQILLNLLSNAVKFTDHGQIVVEIEAEPADDNYCQFQFSVSDSGIGISPDRLDRLFKPFSQVDASTTRQYGGTGLGLVISKRLSMAMGGDMWVESEPGNGSTFYFTVKMRTAEKQSDIPQHRSRLAKPKQTDSLDPTPNVPLRILIAEDNLVNQMVATKMLERQGYRADVVGNGEEAVEAVQRQTYDLILMDIRMPHMDGIEATQYIRREITAKMQPIIVAVTADALTGVKENLLATGMDDYISKPIQTDRLTQVLESVTQKVLSKTSTTE